MVERTQKTACSAEEDLEKRAERAPTIWRALVTVQTVVHLDLGLGREMSLVPMVFRSTGVIQLSSLPEPVQAAGGGQTWLIKTEGDPTRQILVETY